MSSGDKEEEYEEEYEEEEEEELQRILTDAISTIHVKQKITTPVRRLWD